MSPIIMIILHLRKIPKSSPKVASGAQNLAVGDTHHLHGCQVDNVVPLSLALGRHQVQQALLSHPRG